MDAGCPDAVHSSCKRNLRTHSCMVAVTRIINADQQPKQVHVAYRRNCSQEKSSSLYLMDVPRKV